MFPGKQARRMNTRSASPVAVTADQGLVGARCGCTVLNPLSLFLYGSPTSGFKGGGSFVYGVLPGTMVFGRSSINAHINHKVFISVVVTKQFLKSNITCTNFSFQMNTHSE